MKPVIAEFCRENRLTKRLGSAVLSAWWEEKKHTPDLDHTLFALVNAVTRAGQTQSNEVWVKFDELGGKLARMSREQWQALVRRAASLKTADVERAFERFSLSA